MSQVRNRSHGESASKSRSKSKSKSKSRSRSRSLSSTSSGRAAKARNWNGDSGYRLHVSPLNPRTSRRDIENLFAKFGTINEVWMATNPPCFAFVNFKHRDDAEEAMQAMDGKSIDNTRVGVSFARKRTIGGRRGGGGGGSYNNGGDRYPRGDRDDSRYRRRYSPRPSNDRNYDRRRRYSRSRSPVQHNKRDYRQRSRSASPKPRRNRPSSRDRSPQQQASNIVHRYEENDD
jgi:arginine/serine-rich splicing factor 7